MSEFISHPDQSLVLDALVTPKTSTELIDCLPSIGGIRIEAMLEYLQVQGYIKVEVTIQDDLKEMRQYDLSETGRSLRDSSRKEIQ